MTLEDFTGYALVLRGLIDMDYVTDDDIKDVIVEYTCDIEHYTDKELDEAVVLFRTIDTALVEATYRD